MLINDLVLIHRKSSGTAIEPKGNPWFVMKTCLRSLTIGWKDWPFEWPEDKDVEVLHGAPAYQRILEVISGLHSPLFGETEVFGQFKQASSEFEIPEALWRSRFNKLFRQLSQDAKVVRKKHLHGGGSQSYGSAVRREVKDLKNIHIIGAGQLVQEMLPWLSKVEGKLVIHARSPEKVQGLVNEFPRLELSSLLERESISDESLALVIAAPLSSTEIAAWMDTRSLKSDLIIDLRGECEEDPIAIENISVIDLKGVFAKISANKEKQKIYRAQAQKEILNLTAKRANEIEFRPFGWDDLCALT